MEQVEPKAESTVDSEGGNDPFGSRDADIHAHTPLPDTSYLRKLGRFATWMLTVGMIINVLALMVLCLVWFGSNENDTWRSLIIKNWTDKSLAIVSTVLRISMSAQTFVITGMLAALYLEKGQVLLQHAAQASSMRDVNSGTYSILWLLWRGRNHESLSRRLLWSLLGACLVLTAALIQFSTFILLAELRSCIIPGLLSVQSVPNYLDGSWKLEGVPPTTGWESTPFSDFVTQNNSGGFRRKITYYPTFAELHEPTEFGDNGETSDTGRTLRAFPPILDHSDRENLQTYDGPGVVADFRVVCTQPVIKNATVAFYNGTLVFESYMSPFSQHPLLTYDAEEVNSTLTSCIMPTDTVTFTATEDWRTYVALCNLLPEMGNLQSEFYNTTIINDANSTVSVEPTTFSPAYLYMETTNGTLQDWANLFGPNITRDDLNSFPMSSTSPVHVVNFDTDGEKTLFSVGNNTSGRISLCYTALSASYQRFSASSSSNRTEPGAYLYTGQDVVLGIDSEIYDYGELAHQLGIGLSELTYFDASNEDRGVMDLQPSNFSRVDYVLGGAVIETDIAPGHTVAILTKSNSDEYASGLRIPIADDIMRFAGALVEFNIRPAYLIQALQSVMVAQKFYYHTLPHFIESDTAKASYFIGARCPGDTAGVGVVITIVLLHMCVSGLVTFVFLTATRVSFLGNAWQTMSQIRSAETDRLLADMGTATDFEVEAVLRREGLADCRVRLQTPADGEKGTMMVLVRGNGAV
jgi:hypothetical protein